MKKILCVAAIALAAFVGMTGCDNSSDPEDKKDPVVTYSTWWIKGSFDNWASDPKHFFVVDELDANKLSFDITGLYNDASVPLEYEFVLVNADNKEYKYAGTTAVTPGNAFVLGDSSAAGSTSTNNVKFIAAKSTYTVRVDITNPTAPSVNLIAGSTDATVVTNAILVEKLEIKGNQFSKINDAVVGAWTATKGTVNGNSMSWDVYVDNMNGEFGFNTMNGWIQGAKPDVTTLVAAGDALTAPVALKSTDGNCSLQKMTKSGSVYTLTVAVDSSKAVADGRYSLSVVLKTVGTEAWVFTAPSTAFITGDITGGWNETDDDTLRPTLTVTAGKATYNFTVTATGMKQFKIATTAGSGWAGLIGFSGVDVTGSSVAIYENGGNLAFDAVADDYVVTIDFSTTYVTSGKPVVTIAVAP